MSQSRRAATDATASYVPSLPGPDATQGEAPRRKRRRVVRPGAEQTVVLGAESEPPQLADLSGISDEQRFLADRPPHWRP